MTFELTTDYAAAKALLSDPRCFVRMVNDAAPKVEDIDFTAIAEFLPVLVRGAAGSPIAIFLLVPKSPTEAEVHFCFSPIIWGRTLAVARAFLDWAWANTQFQRLLGPVPSYNRLALELALAVGFEQYDLQVGAGTKNGRSYDLILTEALRSAHEAV